MAVQRRILNILEELDNQEFDKFKWYLQLPPDILHGISIPKSHLDNANRWETVTRIVEKHNQQAVEVVKNTLQKIGKNDLAETFSRTCEEAQGKLLIHLHVVQGRHWKQTQQKRNEQNSYVHIVCGDWPQGSL